MIYPLEDGKETSDIVRRLNGDKVLIKGNHENRWLDKDADLDLFLEILDYKEIMYKGNFIVMCHYPMGVWNRKHHNSIHLYAHIHSNKEESMHPLRYEAPLSFNVGVDVNNYYPVNINRYIDEAKQIITLKQGGNL